MPQMQFSGFPTKWLARLKRRLRRPMVVLVALLVLVTVAIWAATLWEIRSGRVRALDAEILKNASLARSQEERVLRSVQVLDQALLVLRHDYAHAGASVSLDVRISTMQLDRESVGVVSIIDAEGGVFATTATGQSANFADREYFQYHAKHPEDRLLVGKPILGKLSGKWVVSLTRRISHADGSFAGVVFMAVNPNFLMSDAAPSAAGRTSALALVGLDGTVRQRNNNGLLRQDGDVRDSQLFQALARAPEGHFVDVSLVDGKQRAVSYRGVQGYPLVVVVGSDVDDVLDSRKNTEGVYIGLALLCSGLVVAMGVVVNGAWSRIEGALSNVRASERKFRSIIDASPVPMALNNGRGEITYLNPAFVHAFGYTLSDIPTLVHWWRLAYPDVAYRQTVQRQWSEELTRSGTASRAFTPQETLLRCRDGSDKHVVVGAAALADSYATEHLVVLYDITQQKSVQASLSNLVLEKNALLKEVHHRVKNNLQVITSLLRLESSRAGHVGVKAVLHDMQWRIRSMALLHESLYRSGNFASVQLDQYVRQLSTEVFRAGSDRNSRINLALELQPVTVSMTQATPLGLIVNELISNVLKHGFPDGRIGLLKIELQAPDAHGMVQLRVGDNGVGLPADFERRKGESLGMQMVTDLVLQVNGTLTIGPAPQAVFSIAFTPESGSA